jgi:hypothetical protein
MCNPLSLLGNGSVKRTAATNTQATIEELLGVVFYAVRVVSKESRRLVLPRTSFDNFKGVMYGIPVPNKLISLIVSLLY